MTTNTLSRDIIGDIRRKAAALKKKEGLVRYQVSKTNGGPSYHEWPAAEFVGRMAALVPPARKHVVRYYGALGPRSPLRAAVTEATRERATLRELESGYSVTIAGKAAREVRKAASAAKRAWAACLRKIFEVDPRERAGRAAPGRAIFLGGRRGCDGNRVFGGRVGLLRGRQRGGNLSGCGGFQSKWALEIPTSLSGRRESTARSAAGP